VYVGDGREPVVREVDDDPVGLIAVPFPAGGAGLGEETSERRGETVEGDLEELGLLRRDVGRALGAVREAVDGWQGQRDEPEGGGELLRDGTQPGEVPLGAERKVTKWPRFASCWDSSRYGMMWPNASHGNTTTWRSMRSRRRRRRLGFRRHAFLEL
jgi:hypothetical protein